MRLKLNFSIMALIILTFITFNCKSNKAKDFIVGEKIMFQNKNGSFKFTAIPSMGSGYEEMERSFEAFKDKNKESQDTIIYRTTMKNYFKIRKWSQYKNMPEWQYPYLPVRKR